MKKIIFVSMLCLLFQCKKQEAKILMNNGLRWSEVPENHRVDGVVPIEIGTFVNNKVDKIGGMCTATRVGKRTFITAAHCFVLNETASTRVLPFYRVQVGTEEKIIPIENIFIHPQYSPKDARKMETKLIQYDVALFVVDEKFNKYLNALDPLLATIHEVADDAGQLQNPQSTTIVYPTIDRVPLVIKAFGTNELNEDKPNLKYDPSLSRTAFPVFKWENDGYLLHESVFIPSKYYDLKKVDGADPYMMQGDSGAAYIRLSDKKIVAIFSAYIEVKNKQMPNSTSSYAANLLTKANKDFLASAHNCGLSVCADDVFNSAK